MRKYVDKFIDSLTAQIIPRIAYRLILNRPIDNGALGQWKMLLGEDRSRWVMLINSLFVSEEYSNLIYKSPHSSTLMLNYLHNQRCKLVKRLPPGDFIVDLGGSSPNKGLHHLLNVGYVYKNLFSRNFRLIFVGGLDRKLNKYFAELQYLTEKLGMRDNFLFMGRVSEGDLKSYYISAHVFLLMSEHEGFCVPILESQYFNVPIVAYKSTAVHETIGRNQLTMEKLDYEEFARAVYNILHDDRIKYFLVQNGKKNYLRFAKSEIQSSFLDSLTEIICKE
jgi:glycosyltransferase involved in cell wall biosynthesis